MAETDLGSGTGEAGGEADDLRESGEHPARADVGAAAVPVRPYRYESQGVLAATRQGLGGLSEVLRQSKAGQPQAPGKRPRGRPKKSAFASLEARAELRLRKARERQDAAHAAAFVPIADHEALKAAFAELDAAARSWITQPHQIALARGDLYLYAKDAEEFRAPLAAMLFGGGLVDRVSDQPAVDDAGPRPSADVVPLPADGVPGAGPGLRDVLAPVVASVLALLAEAGMLRSAGDLALGAAARPGLPPELHPAAAPALAGSEIAGAWAPPPRPSLLGPRSAVR